MTTAQLTQTAIDLILAGALRVPVVSDPPGIPERTCVWTPDLTAAEQATLARIAALGRSRVPGITPAEWEVLEPRIAEMRTLRTRTTAQWSALTAAQRDTDLIAWCRDITDVLRAILRD